MVYLYIIQNGKLVVYKCQLCKTDYPGYEEEWYCRLGAGRNFSCSSKEGVLFAERVWFRERQDERALLVLAQTILDNIKSLRNRLEDEMKLLDQIIEKGVVECFQTSAADVSTPNSCDAGDHGTIVCDI